MKAHKRSPPPPPKKKSKEKTNKQTKPNAFYSEQDEAQILANISFSPESQQTAAPKKQKNKIETTMFIEISLMGGAVRQSHFVLLEAKMPTVTGRPHNRGVGVGGRGHLSIVFSEIS